MKTTTFILNEEAERLFAEYGCRLIFEHVTYCGFVEQNDADRNWVALTAESIKSEYAGLHMREIRYLLEARILDCMKAVLWGHALAVDTHCSHERDGSYQIRIYMNAGYFS